MRKLFLFLNLAVLMSLGLQMRAADIYVQTTDPTFNVYTWGPETYGGWTGSLLTSDAVGAVLTEVNGTEYYKFTLETTEGTTRYIIFNKDGVQTENIALTEGDNIFVYPVDGDYTAYTRLSELPDTPVATTYTVAGAQSLMGSNWDTTDTNNDMTLQEDGSYVLVKSDVELGIGNYDYKVVGDHAWGGFELPASGNQTLTISQDGIYNVTFTLNATLDTLTAVAELVQSQTVTYDYYTVAGVAALVGVDWSPSATENDMVLQEDGTYVLVKDSVALEAAVTYDYKVAANHAWGVWELPSNGNQSLNVSADGLYKVTFTLDITVPELTAVATLLEEDEPVEITSYTVAGDSLLLGSNWNTEDTANDMELQEDGTYVLIKSDVELAAGNYDYKVAANHTWGVWELPMSGNQTLTLSEAGIYNVTFTLTLGDEPTLTATAVKTGDIAVDYVLHYGIEGAEWSDFTFVEGTGDYAGKFVAENVEFANADTQFGIKHGDVWYAGVPNEGESYYWIHSGWCTDVPVSTGDVKNFLINEAGTYTFILSVTDDSMALTVTGWPATYEVGDVNGDGNVDVTDVNILVNIVLGSANAADYDGRADLNGDGLVDVTDVNTLVNLILGSE